MRDELIKRYLSFAESLAKKYYKNAPSFIDLSDLISAAQMGLVDAASRFDPNKGSFITYAYYRIRGEIYSWISNELREKCISIDIENEDGSYLRDTIASKPANNFDYLIEDLNSIGRKLLTWYYKERLTTKEIANIIGVKQPYVSKLLRKYTSQLRVK